MDCRPVSDRCGGAYLACVADGSPLAREQDATDLVESCLVSHARAVLFEEGSLAEGFSDLRTGLAGSVLQKLLNYHVRAALVVCDERHFSGRFGDLARESNRSNQFRVFSSREAAVAWLAQGPITDGAQAGSQRAEPKSESNVAACD
jgi:hypothetical protein